jgi:hypothetical protein
MKSISFNLLATLALAILLSISAPMLSSGAYASIMNGKGSGCSDRACKGINAPSYGKQSWTCTSLRQACLQRNAGSAQCQVAHTNCMRTGVFTGPRGTVNNVAAR